MAEIRVEPRRRSYAWIGILIALVIIAGIAYYLISRRTG